MYRLKTTIDIIQTVLTTFNKEIKNILMHKQDDNISYLFSKNYSDLIEQVRIVR